MRRSCGWRSTSLLSRVLLVLMLVGSLMACDSVKSRQSASPTAPSAMGSAAKVGSGPSMPSQFTAPREARTSAYDVTWSVSTVAAAAGGNELKLDYAVKAFEEMYIADRFYNDPVRYSAPDPFGIHRFVEDGSLRLVFAPATYPPGLIVERPVDLPLYSRILAGETRRETMRIKLPVDEYPSEWPSFGGKVVPAPTVSEEVSRVYFVLGYRLRSTLNHAPPVPEAAREAGYIVKSPNFIILAMDVDKIPVKRHTGYMPRFPLPGEPGPDPMPTGSSR